jgi:hypothetical protein
LSKPDPAQVDPNRMVRGRSREVRVSRELVEEKGDPCGKVGTERKGHDVLYPCVF